MRRILLFLILSFIQIVGFSQEIKKNYPYESRKFSLTLNPSVAFSNAGVGYSLKSSLGYFPVNNLVTGLTSTQTFFGSFENIDHISNSLGIFGKYYIGLYKLKPWISAGAEFKSIQADAFEKNEIIFPIGIGLDYWINDKISLELGVYKNLSTKTNTVFSGFYPTIGIKIRF